MKKDEITLSEFQKADLRVGKVVEVVAVEGSQNLLRLKVDLGYDYGVVQIISGIARWYKPTQLKNKKFIFVANLEAKKLMGNQSQGMIVAADYDHSAVLIKVDKKIPEGTILR